MLYEVITGLEVVLGNGELVRTGMGAMPGRVIKLSVEAGEEVERGQEVLVVEAMKMRNNFV